MKNPTLSELADLRTRARQIADSLPPLACCADGRLDPASRSAVSARAQQMLRRGRAVGASLILRLPGGNSETFSFGYARLHPRMPVTETTCFRVASVSKLVMSFGALSLCESGHLALDCDISQTLGYPVRSPHAPHVPITLRMLLTHTSGVCDEGPYGTRGMEPGCTLRELLTDPRSWRPDAPGESFHYSNLGAGIAGVVMEKAAGMPFDDLMRQRVFDPLTIRASYDPRRISPAGDLADGYSVRGVLPPRRRYDAAQLAARPSEAFDPERDYLIAAGRMITDSAGMAGILCLLASSSGEGVLSPHSLLAMRACQDGQPGIVHAGRGLNTAFLPGVFEGFSPVGHQGVAYGMCAECFADPESGAGVGLMTSGMRLSRCSPLTSTGFDLLALGFGAIARLRSG